MNPRKKIDVEEMLSGTPAAVPPEELLEKLKAEIPEELPKPSTRASSRNAAPRGWMKAAAALLLAGVAGLIGYRVTVDSERAKVVEVRPSGERAVEALPPLSGVRGATTVEPEKKTRVTEGGPEGSAVREELPVRKEKQTVGKDTKESFPAPPAGPAKIELRARDASGAALPGVTVKVTGEGVSRTAVTDAKGNVQVTVPKDGKYQVETALSGFQKQMQAVEVRMGEEVEMDSTMPLAPVQQQVVVTGEAPVLDTRLTMASKSAAPPPLAAPAPPPPQAPAKRALALYDRAPQPQIGFTGSPRQPAQAPSTGGTHEPNDAPYGDVFFKEYGTNPFVDTDDDKLSTFGLDVDTGSYTVTRRYLTDGNLPPREAIRVEEFVNAFSYGDRPPVRGDFAIRAEAAPTPFMRGDLYRVVRFNVRGRAVHAKDRKPAVLTFVVDVSGSMLQQNRLELVKKALGLLLDQLKPSDRVGLVVYGSQARRILDPTADKETIREAIGRLVPDGSTNAEDGIRLGYEMAARFRRREAINRVILCSDGVANVGRTGPDSILQIIGREAKENDIELTTVGFGMGNYNDVLMEQLANKGDGRYAYVDTLEEARRIFVEELTGTLQTIATDAKVQVEFQRSVVARWRLIGYENRDIADERFRDDTVDAGEIGAGHSVTALYEIKLKEDAPRQGTAATLRLRYRSKETGRIVELEHDLRQSDASSSWDSAPQGLKLASLVAEFAEVLKGNYWAKDGDLVEVLRRARSLSPHLAGDERPAELVRLMESAERLKRSTDPKSPRE